MSSLLYQADFQNDCRICGTSPTVIVNGHKQPETDLCGPCFFNDRSMLNPEDWNSEEHEDEL